MGRRESTVTVELSRDTELFEMVELYSGDGLEMSGYLMLRLGVTAWLCAT